MSNNGSDEIIEDDTESESEDLATEPEAEPERRTPPEDTGHVAVENNSTMKNIFLKRVLPGVAVGCVAIIAAPIVLCGVGFGAGGIAAGSIAAQMMSAAAVANGGAVATGSAVALLQSAGAAGIAVAANTGLFAMASTVTASVVEIGSRIQNLLGTTTNDDTNHPGPARPNQGVHGITR